MKVVFKLIQLFMSQMQSNRILHNTLQLIRQFINSTYLERNENDTISESTLTVTWSLINALYIPGGILGVFLGGWLTDNVGRYVSIG